MIFPKKYLKVYASCIPVKGYNRSIICDTQRLKYDLIPNGLFDILNKIDGIAIETFKNEYSVEEQQIIDEYINFLFENDYIFFCEEDEVLLFPKLSLLWAIPERITNAILDYKRGTNYDYIKIQHELDVLGCEALELRFFDEIEIESLATILATFNKSKLRHIDIIIKYEPTICNITLEIMCHKFSRIAFIVVHSAPFEDSYMCKGCSAEILYQKTKIENNNHCGIIKPSFNVFNLNNFTESINYNSCLNKKISIDENGLIKNCPTLKKDYGHISNTSLIDVVNNIEFKELWLINKDKVSVCSDCEFRYVCTDCRAIIEKPSDIYSKPLKCGYDPYTNQWTEWSTNPLKFEVKKHYNL